MTLSEAEKEVAGRDNDRAIHFCILSAKLSGVSSDSCEMTLRYLKYKEMIKKSNASMHTTNVQVNEYRLSHFILKTVYGENKNQKRS